MNALDLSTNHQYPNKKPTINISWTRNTISNLYNAVSVPLAETKDALAERLQGVRETASLLYNRMMDIIKYGREKLKDIVEKEARKKE